MDNGEQAAEEGLIHAVFQAEPLGPHAAVSAILGNQHHADKEAIDHRRNAQGDDHALEVHPRKVVHLMVEGMTARKVEGQTAELLRQHMGGEADNRQRHRSDAQGSLTKRRTPIFAEVLPLLPKDRHVDFGEIRRRQTAGEEEQPLHRRNRPQVAMVCVLHNGLMHQRLADIAAETGDTCQRASAAEENHMEQGLSATETANVVQVEGVGVIIHHTGEEEEHQLHQRVVHHVQHRAVGSQGVLLT